MLRVVFFVALTGCAFHTADELGGGGSDLPDAAEPDPDPEPEVDGAVPDPEPEPDAGPLTNVQCGTTVCTGAVCCVQKRGHDMTFTCQMDGDCPGNAATYRCDGPEDCAEGLSCCASDTGSACCN